MSQLDLLGGSPKPKPKKQTLRPRALEIWESMKRGYKNKWNYGKNPDKDWLNILSWLSDAELECGYNKLGEFFPEWPPTHWSFRNLCKERKIPQAKLNKQFTKERSKESDQLIKNLKAGLK